VYVYVYVCVCVRHTPTSLQVCRQHGVPLVINDRVDVALAVGADGVHVGQSDLPADLVRAMIGPSRILGVSVKNPRQALEAAAAGADYLGAGAVLPTGTKDTDVIGLEGLAAVCEAAAPLPVVSIGGVSAANAADTIRAGCAGGWVWPTRWWVGRGHCSTPLSGIARMLTRSTCKEGRGLTQGVSYRVRAG
ncbi:hypothetical protein Vafri_12939, partial [Volvox africanus]